MTQPAAFDVSAQLDLVQASFASMGEFRGEGASVGDQLAMLRSIGATEERLLWLRTDADQPLDLAARSFSLPDVDRRCDTVRADINGELMRLALPLRQKLQINSSDARTFARETLSSCLDFSVDGFVAKDYADYLWNMAIGYNPKLLETGFQMPNDSVIEIPLPVRLGMRLADQMDIAGDSLIYEIGGGRGRLAALIAALYDNDVRMVELDPTLAGKADGLKKYISRERMEVITDDALNVEYRDGDRFILFQPFSGVQLERYVERLGEHTSGREVVVGCVGGECIRGFKARPDLFKEKVEYDTVGDLIAIFDRV